MKNINKQLVSSNDKNNSFRIFHHKHVLPAMVNTSSKKIGYGVSCKMIHGKFLLRIMVKRKFSFNLTLTVDGKNRSDKSQSLGP
jgi:hypothetical protein